MEQLVSDRQQLTVIDQIERSLPRRRCLPTPSWQIRLFEFERNWLSPVMAEWFCVMILLEKPALATGILLAGDAATGVIQ